MNSSEWTALQQRTAAAEGWAVINVDNTGVLEIQRLDEGSPFKDDAAALAFVRFRAARGCEFHRHALKVCERTTPRYVVQELTNGNVHTVLDTAMTEFPLGVAGIGAAKRVANKLNLLHEIKQHCDNYPPSLYAYINAIFKKYEA